MATRIEYAGGPIDMNHKHILNVPCGVDDYHPVVMKQLRSLIIRITELEDRLNICCPPCTCTATFTDPVFIISPGEGSLNLEATITTECDILEYQLERSISGDFTYFNIGSPISYDVEAGGVYNFTDESPILSADYRVKVSFIDQDACPLIYSDVVTYPAPCSCGVMFNDPPFVINFNDFIEATMVVTNECLIIEYQLQRRNPGDVSFTTVSTVPYNVGAGGIYVLADGTAPQPPDGGTLYRIAAISLDCPTNSSAVVYN